MSKPETEANGDDVETTVVETHEEGNQEENEKIKNILEQFKTPEELAKAKQSSDVQYSKLLAEKKALEELYKKQKAEMVKKIAQKDKNALLDMYSEDPDTVDEVSQELFGKWVDELEYEAWVEYTEWEDWERYLKADQIDKLVEAKLKKMLAIKTKEDSESKKKETVTSAISTFKADNEIDDESFDAILSDLMPEWIKDAEKAKKYLDIAYKAWAYENAEANDAVSKQKQKAAWSMQWWKKVSGAWIKYTEEDVFVAKIAWMKLEEYLALKEKNEYFRK